MAIIKARTFSANEGDLSTGNAGPDAIETDLDNIFANDTTFEQQINDLDVLKIGNNPSCRVYNSVEQSFADNTSTNAVFNSKHFDNNEIFDTAVDGTKLICKTAGVYLIFGQMVFVVNSVGNRSMSILINGTAPIIESMIAANQITVTNLFAVSVWNLNVGDFVQLNVKQTSGGALSSFLYSALSAQFGMVRIG